MSLTNLIRNWINHFNAGDIEGLIAMYAEDAVNEQAVLSEPLRGRTAIRELFEADFARAKMVCIEEKVYECGDTAILQWRDPIGLQGCGFFQFKDDRIVHQKGYFDQLTFFRAQGLAIPDQYLSE